MIFIMAWRNIWRNKMRSIVIMLSVAIGLLAGIAILALYKGMMQSRIRTVIDAEITHLQIHHKEFEEDYNHHRPHESLGNMSPIQYKRKQERCEFF